MVREYLEKLWGHLSVPSIEAEMPAARREFLSRTGEVREEEPSYEVRMASFLDWFLFERPLNSGRLTPLELLLDSDVLSEEDRGICRQLAGNVHSLFLARRVLNNQVTLQDLFTRKRYRVSLTENEVIPVFRLHHLVQGRILPFNGEQNLSPALFFHPRESVKPVEREIKRLKGRGDFSPLALIHQLMIMQLRWERYRYVKVEDIYRFGER